jgi:hypothetical protein
VLQQVLRTPRQGEAVAEPLAGPGTWRFSV